MSELSADQYILVDEIVFEGMCELTEEGQAVLSTFLAEIRDKAFAVVKAAGVDPYSISCWSGCTGSVAELSAFLDEAENKIKEMS